MARNEDLRDLHPIARQQFQHMLELLGNGFATGKTYTKFGVFETYRSPQDQEREFLEGNSKARGWQSAHQYGLAVDFVPLLDGREGAWDWGDKHDWQYLGACARLVGLDVPISWDKPHVEHPAWRTIRDRIRKR